jgi:Oxidoreductase family, NAD-binding Rossmann fold
MGIVGTGSPQSRSLQVVGESNPCVQSGQLTFTLGCDVNAAHRKHANDVMRQRGFRDFEANTKDFRDLVNNKSLDCLLVATPDHWHAQVAIEALKAGKDVYCEKPLTLTVAESLAVQKVVKDTGRVLQTGSQQRTVACSAWQSSWSAPAASKARVSCMDGLLGRENSGDGFATTMILPGHSEADFPHAELPVKKCET